jgi:hypothetical protein
MFGERSLTLVAATFHDRIAAVDAASALRTDLPRTAVDVVRPRDDDIARKMEPDSRGIWRTAIRSHVVLGMIGLALGASTAITLVRAGWPAAAASPLLATLFLSVLGLFAGLMVAGLLTLRPDRSRVTLAVRRRNRAGEWAVIAHPTSTEQSERAVLSLRKSGGTVVRSL